jgi:rhodanese-related sulfurtransferase
MQKNNITKIFLLIAMFSLLITAGGCGGGGGGKATDPTLSSLKLSSGTLSPDFKPATKQYTAVAANSMASITITPATASANATISVNGADVASGSASGAINLNVGSNTITIIVENSTGSTTYTVTVTRASDPVYQKITAEKAHEMMSQLKGYILLDVRTQIEFNNERIEGAILIPHTEIESRSADKLPIDKLPNTDQVIFVYCKAGVRSEIAARSLVKLGYTNVFDMGGIDDWPYEKIGAPNWFDVADTSWFNASLNSYTISTPQQLAGIARIVNDRTTDFSGKTITLSNDINLSGKTWLAVPIFFQGVFDGTGHTISNMKIDSSELAIGLFETLGASGTIKNVNFADIDITVCPT